MTDIKFTISEDTTTITQMDFYWEGYGTVAPTNLYLWNLNSLAWDQIATTNLTTEVTISSTITSGFSVYIDTNSQLDLMSCS